MGALMFPCVLVHFRLSTLALLRVARSPSTFTGSAASPRAAFSTSSAVWPLHSLIPLALGSWKRKGRSNREPGRAICQYAILSQKPLIRIIIYYMAVYGIWIMVFMGGIWSYNFLFSIYGRGWRWGWGAWRWGWHGDAYAGPSPLPGASESQGSQSQWSVHI